MLALFTSLFAGSSLLLAACGEDEADTVAPPTATGGEASALTVRVEPSQAVPGSTIRASVVNDTAEQFTYGAAYELEHEVAGGFEQVKLPSRPVIEIGYVAPPGGTGPPVEVELPDDLQPGTYRVVVTRDVPGVGDLSGEFGVSDGT